jgi:hypothetical protein
MEPRDASLDVLLDLDGQVLVVDPEGGHWVRFVVTQVPVSAEKPHGLDYSLTLHGPDGERLLASTTPIRWRGRSAGVHKTIAIAFGRSRLTTIGTRRRYCATSGPWWIPCCAREE